MQTFLHAANEGRGGESLSDRSSPISGNFAAVAKALRRESGENYSAIIVMVSRACRFIECRDAYQWIVQRRDPSGRWRNCSSHFYRQVMIERSGVSGSAVATLRSLATRFGEVARRHAPRK